MSALDKKDEYELHRLCELADKNSASVYTALETLCICFPARISGSENLEKSLDYLYEWGSRSILECSQEIVDDVPCWTRGDWRLETCELQIIPNEAAFPTPYPLERTIRVMANGLSIGTRVEGIKGELVLIDSWEELHEKGSKQELVGKIVLYDYRSFRQYGEHNSFRNRGANEASIYGAVAVLIRTLAPNNTTSGVHTGVQEPYDPKGEVAPIPAACISIEDAELIRRLANRGHNFEVTLKLPCFQHPNRKSRNLIFELKGSELPDEVVIIGGHTDCWDCSLANCQGAHDDGQGVVISAEIVRILQESGMTPKRTIRAVLFVDEEVQTSGANAYYAAHRSEASKIVACIETDMGVGPVCGFGFTGLSEARDMLKELLKPLSFLGNVNNVDESWTGSGVDIAPLVENCNVPGLLLRHEDSFWRQDYFHYHHSSSDTIDKVDIDMLNLNLKVLMCTVWILANSSSTLPRQDNIDIGKS